MVMFLISSKPTSLRKKMKINILCTLLLSGLASLAHAADIAQTVGPLENSTSIMIRCAIIAKSIHSIPVPAGQAEALMAEHHNQVMTKEHAVAAANKSSAAKPKEVDAEHLKTISAEQKAFKDNIRVKQRELRKCGDEYLKTHAAAVALAKRVSTAIADPKNQPNDDDKKIGAALMSFTTAGENLSTEVGALSNSAVHQMYVSRIIRKYFLGHDISAD